MTPAKFGRIKKLQVPDEEKRRRADYIIDTGTTFERTRAAVRRLTACLSRRAGRSRKRENQNQCAKLFSILKPPDSNLRAGTGRSEEHTSELQSLMRISYAVFCLKTKINNQQPQTSATHTK